MNSVIGHWFISTSDLHHDNAQVPNCWIYRPEMFQGCQWNVYRRQFVISDHFKVAMFIPAEPCVAFGYNACLFGKRNLSAPSEVV